MERGAFDDLQRVLDRHARRVARELGGLLVDLGEALRRQGEEDEPVRAEGQAEPSREDLLREAARLGVKGRSRMTKDELRAAIERMK